MKISELNVLNCYFGRVTGNKYLIETRSKFLVNGYEIFKYDKSLVPPDVPAMIFKRFPHQCLNSG